MALRSGAIAQMGERLLCTQEVGSSILPGSTNGRIPALRRAKRSRLCGES
jgi:fumarate hydratase class II